MKNTDEKNGQETKELHRCGFMAVAGLPNAGKSTLINTFLDEKVSIVSPKPQTTRTSVTCILSDEAYQVIFVDTPGILSPRYRMQEVMANVVQSAVEEADAAMLVVDAADYSGEPHPGIRAFAGKYGPKTVVVALNKIDLLKKHLLLPIMDRFARLFPSAEIIPISALGGDGVNETLEVLVSRLPEGPKLFPDDVLSNEPVRFFAAELIRETLFHLLQQEVPYSTAVMIDSWEDKQAATVIMATIYVEKKSQKPILIGHGGATIKAAGIQAREAIEAFIGRKVYLELHVKVSPDWRSRDGSLRELGLLKR